LYEKLNLLIIRQSGIANEALAAGVPVMILEPKGLANLNDLQYELINGAGCRIAADTNELVSILTEIIADPELFRFNSKQKSKEYLEDLFDTEGEESVHAMINGINKLTQEKFA